MYIKLKQTGDTIVEVLIAIAVISVVLSGAYTVANKSSVKIRDAQERGEAQKFASEIVERLSNNAKNNSAAYTAPVASRYFCIVTTNNTPYLANHRIDMPAVLPAVDATTGYNLACNKQNNPVGYNSIIERSINLLNPTDFTIFNVYVRWPAPGGGFNEVKFVYRISQ